MIGWSSNAKRRDYGLNLLSRGVLLVAASVHPTGAADPPTELPGNNRAALHDAFLGSGSPAVPVLQRMLESRGYQTSVRGATVENLMTVPDAAFFWLGAHGGYVTPPGGKRIYGVQTETRWSPELEAEYRRRGWMDPLEPQLVVEEADYPLLEQGKIRFIGGVPVRERRKHFYFTHHWVRARRWRFPRGSFVFMDSCSSHPDPSKNHDPAFRAACLDAGASLYVGWSDLVDSLDSYGTALFLVDRLLGANEEKVAPPKPPQRAFDHVAVKLHMLQQEPAIGVYTVPGSNDLAEVMLTPGKAGPPIGLLAPSIRYMDVDEWKHQLTLHGLFGTDPRNRDGVGEVKVGEQRDAAGGPTRVVGKALEIVSWGSTKIVCNLPLNGSGSSGDVQVQVRGLLSNVRQLTEWKGRIEYELAGPGTLRQYIDFHFRFRGDVGSFRDQPGEASRHRVVNFCGVPDPFGTYARYNAGGQAMGPAQPMHDAYQLAFAGGGEIPFEPRNGHNTMALAGEVHTGTREVKLCITAWKTDGMVEQEVLIKDGFRSRTQKATWYHIPGDAYDTVLNPEALAGAGFHGAKNSLGFVLGEDHHIPPPGRGGLIKRVIRRDNKIEDVFLNRGISYPHIKAWQVTWRWGTIKPKRPPREDAAR